MSKELPSFGVRRSPVNLVRYKVKSLKLIQNRAEDQVLIVEVKLQDKDGNELVTNQVIMQNSLSIFFQPYNEILHGAQKTSVEQIQTSIQSQENSIKNIEKDVTRIQSQSKSKSQTQPKCPRLRKSPRNLANTSTQKLEKSQNDDNPLKIDPYKVKSWELKGIYNLFYWDLKRMRQKDRKLNIQPIDETTEYDQSQQQNDSLEKDPRKKVKIEFDEHNFTFGPNDPDDDDSFEYYQLGESKVIENTNDTIEKMLLKSENINN